MNDKTVEINLEEYIELRQESEILQNILKAIMDNSRLNYDKNRLVLDDDTNLMTYISIQEETIYNDTLAELKEKSGAND